MGKGGLCTEGGASYHGNHALLSKLQVSTTPGFLEVFSII